MANALSHDLGSSRRVLAAGALEPGGAGSNQSEGPSACPFASELRALIVAEALARRCVDGPLLPCEWTHPTAQLRFAVSSDEEYVCAELMLGSRRFDLGARVHNYLLLILARQRVADQSRALPDSACGWIAPAAFQNDPTLAPSRVSLYVHRLRRQLQKLGTPAQFDVFERRPRQQIRIAVRDLVIERV